MRKLALKLIKFYQNHFHHQKLCKYEPTCSNYALEAFQKFSFFKAFFLTIWRLLRCNPWSKGGYDPVPLTKQEKLNKQSK
jgi:putative membrane protein insertion efficiency factor